jgi:hypothetical protein
MPVFTFIPWEKDWQGDTELELCGATFCFQLKDKGHRVNVFYHEHGDGGSLALDISLQKKEGYKEYVKKMVELDLPPVPLNELPFFSIYETVMKLFSEKRDVQLTTKWEDGDARLRATVILDSKRVYTLFRAVCGPYELYYQSDVNTKEHDKWLRHFLINAAGLYLLFKEYVKREPTSREPQEKA